MRGLGRESVVFRDMKTVQSAHTVLSALAMS